jgi:hypothetical protein
MVLSMIQAPKVERRIMRYELSDCKWGGAGQAAGAPAGRRAFAAYRSSRWTIRSPPEQEGEFQVHPRFRAPSLRAESVLGPGRVPGASAGWVAERTRIAFPTLLTRPRTYTGRSSRIVRQRRRSPLALAVAREASSTPTPSPRWLHPIPELVHWESRSELSLPDRVQ